MQIETKQLVRHFGKTRAVDGISFTFSSGDIFGFVGPNGSGKTTTMRIMATLDEPTDGDVLIDGVSLVDYPEEARRSVGFMPDSLPNHSDISVLEYIDFYARAYGLRGKERQSRVDGVVEFTQLGDLRWKMLNALSKGMKQRVSLARMLVHDPPVLIMDEPAAGLDPRARVELRELLKILSEQNKAILISSHILTELSEICTGAVFIEQGHVLQSGGIAAISEEHHENRQAEIAVRALEIEPNQLVRLALEAPSVADAKAIDERLAGVRILCDPGPETAASVLKFLIDRGVRVTEFTPRKADLEDVFMAITEGKVQ
jgi:ABC-2 type transport system ATP-binding protein